METGDSSAVQIINESAVGPIVFVCEHASNRIPAAFDHIGISESVQQSHAGWDIGALALSIALSNRLASPLVASTVSRLVYDCNRAPDSDTAIVPEIVPETETESLPGNQNLSHVQRLERIEAVYDPFSEALSDLLDQRLTQNISTCLVTVHSFTPVFCGQIRHVELGVLHDSDSFLADLILKIAPKYTTLVVERNQPYGPSDDVTHTLQKHALPRNMLNVMLEIKNDLLVEPASVEMVCDVLSPLLEEAINEVHIKQN